MIRILCALLIAAAAAVVAWRLMPSRPADMPPAVPEEAVAVEFQDADPSPVPAGSRRQLTVLIHNNLDRPIRIVGHNDLCTFSACLRGEKQAETTVGPRAVFAYPIEMFANQPGEVEIPFEMYFDAGVLLTRTAVYRGRVEPD